MFSQAERSSNGTDSSSSLHLLVPTALLFKVRLKKKNQNQKKKKSADRFGLEAGGQEKLEIFI